MHGPDVAISRPEASWPVWSHDEPSAVLLDARSDKWISREWLECKGTALIGTGCRWFVCYGPHAELVHELVDELVERDPEGIGVATTAHRDESVEDVAAFFRLVALRGMRHGLVLTENPEDWASLF